MTAEEVITELRVFASKEKLRWQFYRDRCTTYSEAYAAYNGRHWWIGQMQRKLDTIARKQRRHEKKQRDMRFKVRGE